MVKLRERFNHTGHDKMLKNSIITIKNGYFNKTVTHSGFVAYLERMSVLDLDTPTSHRC